jgi:hypothetical protein
MNIPALVVSNYPLLCLKTAVLLAQKLLFSKQPQFKTKTSRQIMIVKLRRKDVRYSDLTPEQQYVVIGIEADDFRILNDKGQPYLYPADLFQTIDAREPQDWISEQGEDGERYAYPPPLNAVGFFEDFFDANQAAVVTFWRVVNQRLAIAAMAV